MHVQWDSGFDERRKSRTVSSDNNLKLKTSLATTFVPIIAFYYASPVMQISQLPDTFHLQYMTQTIKFLCQIKSHSKNPTQMGFHILK